jgi:tRNA pseudouridine38-40 synthase
VRVGLEAREARLSRGPRELKVLFRVTLAYDGTDFLGWQAQDPARGGRTVQGTLESALAHFASGERVVVTGAGRTDAGVHAEGQVASFVLPRALDGAELKRALNGILPADVRVLDAAPAHEGFHPRKDARSKLYRYVLDTGPVQLPTRRRFAGHVPWTLDPSRVSEAAALYRGRHDFASVASAGGSVVTTERTVTRSDVRFDGATLTYEVEAEGFLRKMVRSLVGGLVAVGRGALSLEDLAVALRARDRGAWPAPAEARGLTLVRVDYPSEPRC